MNNLGAVTCTSVWRIKAGQNPLPFLQTVMTMTMTIYESENPGNVKKFITVGIHVIRNFAESERFPHADFATYSSWSHGFTRLTNHRPLGLEVRIHCYTIDNRQWTFWLSKFPRNFTARTFRPGTCSKKVNRVHLDFMLI